MAFVRAIGWVLLVPAILVLSYGIGAHLNGRTEERRGGGEVCGAGGVQGWRGA